MWKCILKSNCAMKCGLPHSAIYKPKLPVMWLQHRLFLPIQPMSESNSVVPSPCVRNCCLNEHNICLGCFRTLDENCGWSQANDQQRKRILANIVQRRTHSALNRGH